MIEHSLDGRGQSSIHTNDRLRNVAFSRRRRLLAFSGRGSGTAALIREAVSNHFRPEEGAEIKDISRRKWGVISLIGTLRLANRVDERLLVVHCRDALCQTYFRFGS